MDWNPKLLREFHWQRIHEPLLINNLCSVLGPLLVSSLPWTEDRLQRLWKALRYSTLPLPISLTLQKLPRRVMTKEEPPGMWAEPGPTVARKQNQSLLWAPLLFPGWGQRLHEICQRDIKIAVRQWLLCVCILLLWMNSVLAPIFCIGRICRELKALIFNPVIARFRGPASRPQGD